MAFAESFDSFVAPVENKSVPNHLLDTSKFTELPGDCVGCE